MKSVGIDEDEAVAAVQALIGVPNGLAGLNADGNIIGTVEHRTGTAVALSAITLLNNELAIATDTKEMLLGDGATVGGILIRNGDVHYRGRAEILTTFTGSESGSPAFSFPVVTGGIYDISGTLGFSGDTDNLSNAVFRWSGAGVTVLLTPEASDLKFIMPSYTWLHTTGAPVTPDHLMNPVSDTSGTWSCAPVTLDKAFGVCKFHVRVPVLSSSSGTYGMKCFLRTAKALSPTIMASYEVAVRRVK